MHKSKIKQITLAVCLAFMPFSGYAAGLGRLNVNSGLGEPLKAEIELLSVTPDELSTLVAAIASEEAYAAQGVTRLGIHNNIQVEVSKNTSGSPILKLRSTLPISDPYLDMLIQVDWASGRLQREYTVLLDPPGYRPAPESTLPMAVAPATTTAPANATPRYPSEASTTTSKKSKKTRKAPIAAEAIAESTDGYEIKTERGDTLGAIAKAMQMEGVSLDQMLVGLYEHNKSAFEGNNINRLKVGQILRVPSKEVLIGIDRQEARQAVKVHSENWTAYRNNLAGLVTESPAMAETEQKQATSGKIGAAEDKAAVVKAGPQDVVKLSAGERDPAKGTTNSVKEFESKIIALQEETTAREKALKEAQERTAALEKQIQDMQKLLALKSQAMTDAQKNAEATAKDTPAVTAPIPAAQPTESVNTSETPAATSTQPVTPMEAPVPSKPKKAAPPQTPPAPEEDFLTTINNMIDLTILAAIAGIALLAGMWVFLRNKRRRDLDSFERGILTSGGLRANTVFGNTTGTASTSDTSFLTDFAQSADGSMIDTNDVDPIAEAEVYMAYGRDAQAEEILKDAISKEPKRYELHLKLLEMYAARKDTSAFEAIAGELYTTLGADDPTWIKVAEMGHTMEPENPLYDVSNVVANTVAATQMLNADFANIPVKTDADLDFSLGDEDTFAADKQGDAGNAVMQGFSTAPETESELSFDLGSFEPAPTSEANMTAAGEFKPEEVKPEEVKQVAADNTLDFDLGSFDLNTETTQEDASMKTMDSMAAFNMPESNEISFEAPSFEMPAPTNESAVDESFSMEFNLPESSVDQPMGGNTLNDLSFELSDTESGNIEDQEISFDLPALEEEPAESANSFDLSNISLELNDAPMSGAAPELQDAGALAAPESADVDIKLDLVAAYLDMNDTEGARELLEEVLKGGGPQQQAKARDLLATLT